MAKSIGTNELNDINLINQKVIIIKSEKVAKILEEKPFEIKWCSICNQIVRRLNRC